MLVEAILISIGGGTIIWSFWWSRNERRRKAKAQFVKKLTGSKTVGELRTECELKYGIRIYITSMKNTVTDVALSNHIALSEDSYKEIFELIGKRI